MNKIIILLPEIIASIFMLSIGLFFSISMYCLVWDPVTKWIAINIIAMITATGLMGIVWMERHFRERAERRREMYYG